MSKRFIDAKEVARLLGVRDTTVYKWSHEGRIPSYRFGRCVRFIEGEVMDWAENQRSRRTRGRGEKI
ncbi:DNA-binding protein [candidate division TA06 bacterium]|uniref:DNA-binding protein n=1 Tax=candidate division TA06 bacterium TaxID=2250710 RepID=A0A523USB5_UNCT6|nr:MAG: DNA-binding protein [candidate division TA06 bacterium]